MAIRPPLERVSRLQAHLANTAGVPDPRTSRHTVITGLGQPGARERLVVAAVDLFTEQGYDATTVAQIAERAGVTKSTFFRHFPDKRELLVAGQETLSRLLTEGIAEAPGDASPLEAVAAGLERAASAMGPMNRELAPRLKAAVAASAELQERDALKSVSLAAAMTTALVARGIPDPTAALAGELGVLAFKRGFAQWSEGDRDGKDELAGYTLAALDELRAASASLG
ncbi:helix-turn-helix domain-containing protein [Streptomyces sp. NPDC020298]|uniref:TetR/AcrR family transcriptional regulator n=1 Tax=unclassified Streptomyces TaxID=2593676 RepID=UPI0033F99951